MGDNGHDPVVKLRAVFNWTPGAETESPRSHEVGKKDREELYHPFKWPKSSVFYRTTILKSFTDEVIFFL